MINLADKVLPVARLANVCVDTTLCARAGRPTYYIVPSINARALQL